MSADDLEILDVIQATVRAGFADARTRVASWVPSPMPDGWQPSPARRGAVAC